MYGANDSDSQSTWRFNSETITHDTITTQAVAQSPRQLPRMLTRRGNLQTRSLRRPRHITKSSSSQLLQESPVITQSSPACLYWSNKKSYKSRNIYYICSIIPSFYSFYQVECQYDYKRVKMWDRTQQRSRGCATHLSPSLVSRTNVTTGL